MVRDSLRFGDLRGVREGSLKLWSGWQAIVRPPLFRGLIALSAGEKP